MPWGQAAQSKDKAGLAPRAVWLAPHTRDPAGPRCRGKGDFLFPNPNTDAFLPNIGRDNSEFNAKVLPSVHTEAISSALLHTLRHQCLILQQRSHCALAHPLSSRFRLAPSDRIWIGKCIKMVTGWLSKLITPRISRC